MKGCVCSYTAVSALAPALWHNREVVLAIFQCYNYRQPWNRLDQFDSDEELWLQVTGEHHISVFAEVLPSNFCENRTFLLKVVRANPEHCLEFLVYDPPLDFDLILAACATQEQFVDTLLDRCLCLLDHEGDDDDHLYEELCLFIPREVRDRTSRYLSFLGFVRGILPAGASTATATATESSTSEAPPVRAPVTLLNQDPDMAQLYQALLAALVEIPSGDGELATELSCLKRLTVALARRGL